MGVVEQDARVHDRPARIDPRRALIDRIVASPQLRSSARLSQFLIYVADCTLRGAPEDATEQQIGIHLFGRPPGYNSSEDSIVRSHARLLRQKLADYFAENEQTEDWIVEIPKGHYLPVFRPRHHAAGEDPQMDAAPDPAGEKNPSRFAGVRWSWRWAVAAVVAAALLVTVSWRPWRATYASHSAVDTFWAPFLTGEPPLVIFSNALFTGDSKTGLRYASPESDPHPEQARYIDTYTGIGELASVYNLAHLFDARNRTFMLKRSLLVTWDEAQLHNLIFIGSSAENTSLRVLPATTDFTMEASADEAGVINHHPRSGEPAVYSRPEHPLTTDYAILALLPGMRQGQRILIFSGLTTFGTQAAVDYVSQPDTAAELLGKITGPDGKIHPFEAVVQTNIVGGVPMQTHLVSIRVH